VSSKKVKVRKEGSDVEEGRKEGRKEGRRRKAEA
jgi:hypothetical protein